jgi:hypothetical protein
MDCRKESAPECSVGGIKLRIIESKAKGNSPFFVSGLRHASQAVGRDERPLSAEHKQLLVRHTAPTSACSRHFCMRLAASIRPLHLSMPQSMNMEFRGLLFAQGERICALAAIVLLTCARFRP